MTAGPVVQRIERKKRIWKAFNNAGPWFLFAAFFGMPSIWLLHVLPIAGYLALTMAAILTAFGLLHMLQTYNQHRIQL